MAVYELDFERPLRGLWVLARADAICGEPASAHLEVSHDGKRWEHADTLALYHKVDWRHAILWTNLSRKPAYGHARTLYVRLRMESHAGDQNPYVASFRKLLIYADDETGA